jgi:hypothetical protein
MCEWHDFPVFQEALDVGLLAEWLKATNHGDELHALTTDDFSQGFLMGRVLSLMERQLDVEGEENDDDEA